MNHIQFETFYGEIKKNEDTNKAMIDNGIKGMQTALANPQRILSWLKDINVFQSKTHSEPVPLVVDLNKLNDAQDDSFWKQWSSKRQKSIQFCENLAS